MRNLRKSKDISLNRLAKAIGVSGPYLSDVENNNRSPLSAARIEEVAAALKIDPTQLHMQAGLDRNMFKLSAHVSALHDRVAAILSNRWENLSEADLTRLLKAMKVD